MKLVSWASLLRNGPAYLRRSAELSLVRDERDRILRSLEKLRTGRSLPAGLRGRQVCFMHIGKTAGTSLQHALMEAMSDAAVFHESLENFDTVAAAELWVNDLVIGHFAYQHVAKLRPDRFLITFLRDPIERVLSSYGFLRSVSPVSDYSRTAIDAAKALTLSEFIRCHDPAVRMVTENFQAKSLAYDVRPEYRDKITELYGEAARNLSNFDFVGIVEYFAESLAALSQEIGVLLPNKRLNITEARRSEPRASREDIEYIRRLNTVDLALYGRAVRRFRQTILRRVSEQAFEAAQPAVHAVAKRKSCAG
jgi:hypothetical protein